MQIYSGRFGWRVLTQCRVVFFFSWNVTSPKVKGPMSWAKVKLTFQLGTSQSNPMFLVTSSLKLRPIQCKAKVPAPSNTDCTCAQVLVPAVMGREGSAPPSLPHMPAPLRMARRKQGGRVSLCSSGPHYVGHCCFSLLCQWQVTVAISIASPPIWVLNTEAFYHSSILGVGKAGHQALFSPQKHTRCREGNFCISSRHQQWKEQHSLIKRVHPHLAGVHLPEKPNNASHSSNGAVLNTEVLRKSQPPPNLQSGGML